VKFIEEFEARAARLEQLLVSLTGNVVDDAVSHPTAPPKSQVKFMNTAP
jgi:hypothetical protein